MKSVCIVFCFLILPSYLSPSPIAEAYSSRRQLVTKQWSLPFESVGKEKLQVVQKIDGSGTKRDSRVTEHNGGDEEGLIYYIDYHGVSTHPSPRPKHPNP